MGDLLREAQEAGFFDGQLSSCETELQELLRQIDIMLNNKQQEWETEKETLKLQYQAREHEMMSQRVQQDASQKKVGQLQQQVDGMSTAKRQLVTDYEQQLSQLRNQLSNLQRDYEKVQKRHSKQTSNAEKARDETLIQLQGIEQDRDHVFGQWQETKQQLIGARNQVMDYKNKLEESDVQRRSQRQQVEALESQRATLAEKCQLMQDQSLGYQEQLSKRRQMLEQTELNYKSRLTHLEGQLSRAQDALDAKNATIQSLEDRLMGANSGKMRVEEESSRQLQTLERTNRDLEEQLSRLQIELQSRDDLEEATELDMRRTGQQITRLQESLTAKDDVIRHLEEAKQGGELVEQMRQQLEELQEEALHLHQNERHWKEEVERLQSRLDDSHIECANLNTELAQRIGELRHMESTELRQLAEDLIKARNHQQEVEEHHQAVMDGMKKEISALTSDLHDRDVSIATMNSQMSALQRQLSNVIQHKDRQEAELKLTNTELEALQLEHRNLREVRALDVSSTSRDLQQAEIQLQELQQLHQQHVQSSKTLEVENDNLRHDLLSVRHQLQTVLQSPASSKTSLNGHYSADTILNPSANKDRKLQNMESQHRKEVDRLQERLDSTVQHYEGELRRLHGEQERFRTNLKEKAHVIKRLQAENNALGGFVNSAETIARSPPSKSMDSSFSNQSLGILRSPGRSPGSRSVSSLPENQSVSTLKSPASRQLFRPSGSQVAAPSLQESHSFPELFLSPARSFSDQERPGSRASITANFVEEDKRRRQELEQLLDSRLNDLEQRTTWTLERHIHRDTEQENG